MKRRHKGKDMSVEVSDVRRIVNEIYPAVRALRRDLHRRGLSARRVSGNTGR